MAPPVNTLKGGTSFKNIQTQIGPSTLSNKTSKLTSEAGRKGVAQVTNAMPSPIVNEPIKILRKKSF